MRAARLFVVFATAKLVVLWGRELPPSLWTPLVYLWQDLAVALVFLGVERTIRRDWAARIAFGALVGLTAVNVPVTRVLSSPLTMPMLRAARGTLADSIRYHATLDNLAGVAIVLMVAILLSFSGRLRFVGGWKTVTAAAAVALVGALATSRVDTAGLERHPLVALLRTSVSRVQAAPMETDWRASPFSAQRADVRSGSRFATDHDFTAGTATKIRSVSDGGASGWGPVRITEDLARLRATGAGRNVLLVVLESTAARYLRAYGAAEDPTPNLTALAARSIVFEHAYAVYPESVKGLVSVLASRYPGFDVPAERHAAAASPSLATLLAAQGYDTALFHSGRFMYLGMAEIVKAAGFSILEDAGDIGGHRSSSFGIDEAAAVSRILDWIDARPPGRRFFAAYLPIAGHHPYVYGTPGPFPENREIDRYRSALFEGDRALGQLIDGLRARGLDRSTLLVVAADHGEAFGQHAGNYGHTLALFDENVRVPLVFAMAGVPNASLRVQRPASLIDVAPTIVDLMGLETPRAFQGESLLPPGLPPQHPRSLLKLKGEWRWPPPPRPRRSRAFLRPLGHIPSLLPQLLRQLLDPNGHLRLLPLLRPRSPQVHLSPWYSPGGHREAA
ncbi:MAG: sulfatase [Acidobacteria bacterium]|nr:sulfatase [Acidobacteriota bacterium]